MKKVIMFVLIVGLLVLGTFFVGETSAGTSSHKHEDFSGTQDSQDPVYGGVTINGGGQGGGGPAPG